MTLKIGDLAPDFTLQDQFGQDFTLSDYRGKKSVLVVFYPHVFSGVCTGELTGFRDQLELFDTPDSTLVAISCDPIFAIRAFADRDSLFFPLLSDYWPHGEVAAAYGAFDDEKGSATRSSFVIDKQGRVQFTVHNPSGEARDTRAQGAALAQAATPL